MSNLNFLDRAAKLGHSVEALKAGQTISSVISVPNIEELKKLMDDGSSGETKTAAAASLLGATAAKTDDSHEGLVSRVNAHVFGNAPLSAADKASIQDAFPVKVMATSGTTHTYDPKENVLGVSQLLVTVNFGTVTLPDQGYLSVYNSTLSFTVDTFIRNGKPPAGKGDFNILGVTGGVGKVGDTGSVGTVGTTGAGGNCSSAGIAGASGQDGKAGNTGGVGVSGATGGNGLPSMPATITINNNIQGTNSIIIFTASGAGGAGGTGGTGGIGGAGGGGGNGATCGCTGSSCGNGANGGVGGNGGTGGVGGNGTNANGNIIVKLPSKYSSYIQPVKGDALPGSGGQGGNPGAGGGPGYRGSNGKHNSGGSNGNTGGVGTKGATGSDGSQKGVAGDIKLQPF